jgi:hypothetical protein
VSLSPHERPKRRPGRPRKGDAPKVPWDVVDRALVHGEKEVDPETGRTNIRYPTMEELGNRYGVSKNRVWQYASGRKCLERRKEAEMRERFRYDAKISERKAEARALASEDLFGIIDAFVERFRKGLDEGDVRADSPADFDRLVRLKELLQGNADSRQSIQGSLSLDSIQQRHQKLRAQLESMNPAASGVEPDAPPSTSKGERARDAVH